MIVKVEVAWSADDQVLLGQPGISRAAAAIMLGVNPITIGRWAKAKKVEILPDGRICTKSLRAHVEAEIAEAIARLVRFGGKADA